MVVRRPSVDDSPAPGLVKVRRVIPYVSIDDMIEAENSASSQ